MIRFLIYAWTAFALAGAVCFGVVAYKASRIPTIPDLHPLILHGDGVLTRLEGIESKANATLINIDDGTRVWAASAKSQARSIEALTVGATYAIQDARGAIGDVQKMVTTATEQEAHVGPLLDSLKSTSDSAQPVLGQLALTASASTQTLDAINIRIRDPKIDELMGHIRGMSASGDSMLADAAYKTHQLLHPDKKRLGFWGSTLAVVDYIRDHDLPKVSLF